MSASIVDGHDASPPAGRLPESAARIESLLDAAAASGPVAASRAEDLVSCVSSLYGGGLERVLQILEANGALTPTIMDALTADELVSGLMLVHDLHPQDVEQRVRSALDSVRPYLGTHGGDVELVGIDDAGVLTLRLLGSCDGCPSSSVTLELAVEGAVQAAAPELTGIEVLAASSAVKAGGVISLDSLRSRIDTPAAAVASWVALPELASLAPGELGGFEVDGMAVCGCRIGSDVYCFRDECGHCGDSLAGGVIERRLGDPVGTGVLRCGRCRAHFDIVHAGMGLDDATEHLMPLPVLIRDGAPSIAVPTAAT